MASAVEKNATLTTLWLGQNEITHAGAARLAGALAGGHCALESLDLGNNEVGDDGARCLAQALVHNTGLSELRLHHNRVSDQGAAKLAQALRVNQQLRVLWLSGNGIRHAGALCLGQALRSRFAQTQQTDEGLVSFTLHGVGLGQVAQHVCGFLFRG